MIAIDKTAYKATKADKTLSFSGLRIDIKGYETDCKKDYVIIDIDPNSSDANTIIVRRLYTSYGNEYFTYRGMWLYLFDFSRVL